MASEISGWDSAYQYRPYSEKHPHPGVIYLDELLGHKKQHILDLGCGDGRHLVFLSRSGHNVHGIDKSLWGLRRAHEWLRRENLSATLVCAVAQNLPWSNEFFDSVVSIQVIHHNRLAEIIETVGEVRRVLSPGGYFYLTVAKYPPANWKGHQYVEVEPHTFEPLEGFERGIPHHFFTKEELQELLGDFEVRKLESDSKKHYSVLAQKKKRHPTLCVTDTSTGFR
ncbi:MAG: class I SAM-dependent methyltransferase [Chloroflexota bacterium]